MRKRISVLKHTKVPVTWAVECPLHPGEKHIEFPVARGNFLSNQIDYSRDTYFCPAGSGHTFNMEDAKATLYDEDGNISASGVTLLDYFDF